MLHGTAPRAAHRAAPGGLALLPRPTGGQHRQPPTRPRLPQVTLKEPQRTMHLVMTGIGALIMLGICGLSSFFVIADERRGIGAKDTGTVVAAQADTQYAISSRRLDPQALSLSEVFSATQIQLVSGSEPYRVSWTHIDSDCDAAGTGALGQLLATAGCTQVVRASMTAPYGGYEVTVGMFNLVDQGAAKRVAGQVHALVETGEGSFASMAAGATLGQDPRDRPDSYASWHEHGHFLVYCVISRPDGVPIAAEDPYARRITKDLLDTYLSEEILGVRERPQG
jgi:hypothetical protein